MKYLLVLFSLSLSPLSAQNLIGNLLTFDGTEQNNWTTIGTAIISDNGTADDTFFWGDRQRIASGSRGNAINLIGAGRGARLVASGISKPDTPELWLRFHQYYRPNMQSVSRVTFWNFNTGQNEKRDTIILNQNLVDGAETGERNVVLLDIGELLRDYGELQIEFSVDGNNYFWLLDDIGLYDGKPSTPTKPTVYGDYLDERGYPFDVDTMAWPHVPNQLVIQFNPAASDSFRNALQDEIGAVKVDSCACDFVELWEIDGSRFVGQGGQSEDASGTTDILNNILKAKKKSMVDGTDLIDGVDLNTYNFTKRDPALPDPAQSIADFAPLGLRNEGWSAVRIAIMDTGIDYAHPRIKPFVSANRTNIGGTASDALNCLDNDRIGWNYIQGNNNPYDDNGHGTHVAGILADSLAFHADTSQGYEFVAYKTHDNNGVSTLFDVICATFQASLDDIDVINDSWGFYGDSSVILANAIDTAATRDIVIVSAAGNEGLQLDTLLQYPACYTAPNVINVAAGSFRDTTEGIFFLRAPFSNFSPNYADIIAPGVDILSAAPDGLPDVRKSGTSMATPMVSAEAAIVLACLREQLSPAQYGPEAVVNGVLGAASTGNFLSQVVTQSRILAYSKDCAINPTSTEMPTDRIRRFEIFPNPFRDQLSLRSTDYNGPLTLRLIDATGREILRKNTLPYTAGATQNITLPQLKAGIYYLQLNGNGIRWTEKLLRF